MSPGWSLVCPQDVLTSQIYAPPFVLSPEAPLGYNVVPGPSGALKSQVLFSPDEDVLLCGYCVSPDQCWLLVVCCDRQGELLDTAVIGITHMPEYGISATVCVASSLAFLPLLTHAHTHTHNSAAQSRLMALQQLWNYLLSIVAGTVVRWNIVITRLGKPSNAEIRGDTSSYKHQPFC